MRPYIEILGKNEIQTIFNAALDILENVGIKIFHEKCLKMLEKNGITVDYKTKNARFSRSIVKELTTKVPSLIKFYDFKGEKTYEVGENNIHYAPGASAIKIFDSDSQKVRSPTVSDLVNFAKVVDILDNIAFQTTALIPSDVPNQIVDRYRVYILLKYSAKPIITGTFTLDGTQDIISLFRAAAEDFDIAKQPVGALVCCPTSPLKWSELMIQSLMECCKSSVPIIVVPAPSLGLTSLGTMAATLAQHTAEAISGVVISQLINTGTPVIFGGSANLFDMRYFTTLLGAIETVMLYVGLAQIGKYLKFPVHCFAGIADSKVVDYQAGQESGIGLLLGALAGINIMHGPGMLEFESCQSIEKLVLDNEICGMAIKAAKGFEVDDKALALDIIRNVGAGGEYIKNFNALKLLKEKIYEICYMPSDLISREPRETFEKRGAKDSFRRAKDCVRKLLEKYKAKYLTPNIEQKMKDIIRSASMRYSVSLPQME